MKLKSEYLNTCLTEEISKDTILFIIKTEDSELVEQILTANPSLREKEAFMIDKFDTIENVNWLAKAKYIISTIELPTFFSKRIDQIYIPIIDNTNWNHNLKRLLLHADIIIERKELPNFSSTFKELLTAPILSLSACNFLDLKPKPKSKKKNIILHAGKFMNNGITSSVLNLMKNLDQEKYQLIVIEQEKLDFYEARNFSKIPEHVITVQVSDEVNVLPSEEAAFIDFHAHPLENWIKNGPTDFLNTTIKTIYKRELKRILGNIEIDVALDFYGYFKHWTLLLASSDSPRKIIYQHNEMMKEYSKKLGANYKHREDLNFIFPLYNYFDVIVSVAKQTEIVNKQHLQHIIQDTSKITYVNNSIDYKNIIRSAQKESKIKVSTDTFNFATMGRLSPEKNHHGLMTAFHQLQQKYPNTQLFIIGLGELEADLKAYAKELGLQNKVHIVGQLENPFPVINACDAFVLSSIHEGQPMVLLECMVLRKPIVATNIPGCVSVLKDGYGLLVDGTTNGLAAGMEKLLLGYDAFKIFDYEAYNKHAVKDLEKLLDGE